MNPTKMYGGRLLTIFDGLAARSRVSRRLHHRNVARFYDEKARLAASEHEAVDRGSIAPERTSAIEQDVLRKLRVRSGDVVLDVGCGSGVLTRNFADTAQRVVGVDLSHGQLARARRIPVRADNTDWIQADFTGGLPFRDGMFDRAICYSVAMYVSRSEFLRGLGEMHRVCKPGAEILIGDLSDPYHLYARLRRYLKLPVRGALAAYARRMTGILLNRLLGGRIFNRGYGWYTPGEFAALARSLGFTARPLRQPPALPFHYWRYDCLLAVPPGGVHRAASTGGAID